MYKRKDILFPSPEEVEKPVLVLVGASFDGPSNELFFIDKGVPATNVLGECTLATRVEMARISGINPAILKINGKRGFIDVKGNTNEVLFTLRSMRAHEECEGISVLVTDTHIAINGIYTQFVYEYQKYKTTKDLCHKINFDLFYSDGEVEAECKVISALTTSMAGVSDKEYFLVDHDTEHAMLSGDTESDESIAEKLGLLSNVLSNKWECDLTQYKIDTLCYADIPYEKGGTALLNILGRFCEEQTLQQSHFCSAVIESHFFSKDREVDIETNADTFNENIQHLLSMSPIQQQLEEDSFAKHIEIVVGDTSVESILGEHNLSSMYGSSRILNGIHNSFTNKEVKGCSSVFSQKLKKSEVVALSMSGYTLIVPSKQNYDVVFKSQNIYKNRSSFQRNPFVLRSVMYCISILSKELEMMVGDYVTRSTLGKMNQRVDDFIEQIMELDIYKNIEYEVITVSKESVRYLFSFSVYGEIESVRVLSCYSENSTEVIEWNE